jgi:XTP/dITP diphosphohydrolase
MPLLRRGDRLVLATHNPGKLREIVALLAPYGISVVSAGELGLPEPEETGTTFRENAEIKARAAAEAAQLPALADDSGLEVAALDGAPGVYSADWGGPEKDFAGAMRRVHEEVTAKGLWLTGGQAGGQAGGPVANFNATLALAVPGGGVSFFEGKVFGRLVWPPRGPEGFGYDPMFLPDGHEKTFGEMTKEEKSGWRPDAAATGGDGQGGLSHRARALALFVAACVEPSVQ